MKFIRFNNWFGLRAFFILRKNSTQNLSKVNFFTAKFREKTKISKNFVVFQEILFSKWKWNEKLENLLLKNHTKRFHENTYKKTKKHVFEKLMKNNYTKITEDSYKR